MHNKIPYYMAYPEFFMYGTERTDRMDYDYMKSTYPDTAKRVLPLVEEECDRLAAQRLLIREDRGNSGAVHSSSLHSSEYFQYI